MGITTWVNVIRTKKYGFIVEGFEKVSINYIVKGFLIKVYCGRFRRTFEISWKSIGWRI